MRRNTLFFTLVLISLALISLAAISSPKPCPNERDTSVERCLSKVPLFKPR